MKKRDFTQRARDVVLEATGQAELPELTAKQTASSKGGKKGGKARMQQLTKKQRSELAKKAAEARWQNAVPSTADAAPAKGRSVKQR